MMITKYRFHFYSFIFSLIFLLLSNPAMAQFNAGASYGIQIPGRQDLKFRYYENGRLKKNLRTKYVKTAIRNILNINALYWRNKFGLRFDYYKWEHLSVAKVFTTGELPPFFKIEQSREAILLSPMIRFGWPFNKSSDILGRHFSFAGMGLGEALTEIEPGRTQWRAAFQVFYGISVPITAKLKVHASFKYLLTRDDDNLAPKDNGWKVDTSGRWHLFRFGPHWDTKYHVLQIGLQWQLF
ncbi:hypothetical protein [Arenibacter sp. NBRC 103722]|uniref:hypothetical protein n=1 Tax=Arenibacter sp. NBRC 103722 TaxID=1113929 RepID=UPI0011AF38DA|nr:hypothetical protein [Arenibacter sp. NBRC 103722]MDX1766417.1 hypothetical protein [Arenibacter troitsensis]